MRKRRTFDDVHFIVGSPRSGTTWLSRALNHHPGIYCTENRLFGEFAGIWSNNDGTESARITLDEYVNVSTAHMEMRGCGDTPERIRQSLLTDYLVALLRRQRKMSGKKLIVDKVTPYLGRSVLTLEKIRQTFPKARLIQLLRDGRDVVTSGTFDWLLRSAVDSWRYRHFVHKEPARGQVRFFDDGLIETWAQYWTNPIVAFELVCPDALQVRYEDMVQDQSDVLARITDCLGVSGDATILRECVSAASFARMSGGREAGIEAPTAKTRKGVIGDWKNYFTRTDGRLFHQLAGDMLLRYGYETRADWYEDLPEAINLLSADAPGSGSLSRDTP